MIQIVPQNQIGPTSASAVERLRETTIVHGREVMIRDALVTDVPRIQGLYHLVYQGKYSVDFAINPATLRAEIQNTDNFLWLVAEAPERGEVIATIVFFYDRINRLAKAAGIVVSPDYRGGGLGTALTRAGVHYLTRESRLVDVVYATTRTINEGPSRMVKEAGFHPLGLFPNAVHMETFEHLTLDVFLTPLALDQRRRKPYLFPPFNDVYTIARQALGLERAYLVTERAPLKLSPRRLPFTFLLDEAEANRRFDLLSQQKRVSNSFFPFQKPNALLTLEEGGTEVFVWFGGVGKQAAILGYRTDRVNVHDVLDSVAHALQKAGAAYVELLVDAYNYMLQQEAFTARFLPSGYFPAMKLNNDGQRDDYFVLSRTFHLLDFTGTFMTGEILKFLRAYLRYYHELYIQPILGGGAPSPFHRPRVSH